ncbi:MAG: Holliday junction branch migration protein RuvA [Firmicutes bacterium]|nr:Holliday junction branch migration protein RuvA [Bacillota bacterium]
MIVELRGILKSRTLDGCVVDVQGIGYGVELSRHALAKLPEENQPVHLYTHLIVREDSWRLIGFVETGERESFLDLMSVAGVGAKVALAILSVLDASALHTAVHDGEWKRLTEAAGVGPKLARRIQLELAARWKLDSGEDALLGRGVDTDAAMQDDVLQGLMGLGYSLEEARQALQQVAEEGTAAERLRAALQQLDSTRGGHQRV